MNGGGGGGGGLISGRMEGLISGLNKSISK